MRLERLTRGMGLEVGRTFWLFRGLLVAVGFAMEEWRAIGLRLL